MGYTLPPPTAPSSSASMTDAYTKTNTLITRKSSIEAALSTQLAILTANNADMHTPLVDPHGFPRADLEDLVAVRMARVRILELRNDLEGVIEEVKRALEEVHAENANAAAKESNKGGEKGDEPELRPFARIDGVVPGSPAATAGLQREDLILSFGSLTLSSLSLSTSLPATRLAPLASLTASHEDRPLELKILRSSSPLTLTLTPSKWGGRGLLGCHIVPYTASS